MIMELEGIGETESSKDKRVIKENWAEIAHTLGLAAFAPRSNWLDRNGEPENKQLDMGPKRKASSTEGARREKAGSKGNSFGSLI